MITLRGVQGVEDSKNKIIFSPRFGFTHGGSVPTLEYPIIYGHKCPYCSNVIQALFKAPKTFSLWPYEETVLLSKGEKNAGDVRKIYPDNKTKKGKSCYRMEFSPAEGGNIKLTLKNHILRTRAIAERKYDGSGIFEEGENPCLRVGIFSLREDLLLRDWLLFCQIDSGNGQELFKYKLPPIQEVISENNTDFKLVPAIGKAPPVILFEGQQVVYGFYYQAQPLIKQYYSNK